MQESLATVLHEVVGLLDRSAEEILRREGALTYPQYYVLSAMAVLGPCSQRVLADWIGRSEPGVSRMLGTLGRAGLVTSTVDEGHRRRNTVVLTDAGAAAERRAGDVLGTALAQLMAASGTDEAVLLAQALRLRGALAGAGRRSRPLSRS